MAGAPLNLASQRLPANFFHQAELADFTVRNMYWPLGAPRVFAAPKKRTPGPRDDDENGEGVDEYDDDDFLLGLCVSRNGVLFATITATSLNIWQTSVSAACC